MITYVYEICGSEYQAAVTILQSGVPWTIGYSVIAFIGMVGHSRSISDFVQSAVSDTLLFRTITDFGQSFFSDNHDHMN